MRPLLTRATNALLNLAVGFGVPFDGPLTRPPLLSHISVEREPAIPTSAVPPAESGGPAGRTDCGFVAYLRATEGVTCS